MIADTGQSSDEYASSLLLYEKQKQRRFQVKVVTSWLALLFVLGFMFSGATLRFGSASINLIHLDLEFIGRNFGFIAIGSFQTIAISIASILLAMVLALVSALARLSRSAVAVAISTFYVSLIRGTPLYLQIIFFFLALPQMGIYLSGFGAGVIALGLNYGAYMSEIFRAGIQAVGKGQHEAATALGMSSRQKLRLIVIPQALRFAIPPIGNEYIAMLKDSSLVAVTGFVREILWRATKLGRSNFRNLEALLVAALFYWILTLIFTSVQNRIEKRYSQGERTVRTYH
ncbi:MAG: amino acid ABC transporter permease [Chloroflexi bacterium]|nr:amino acid ABC transporter permease [Chloroflexota bacterium]